MEYKILHLLDLHNSEVLKKEMCRACTLTKN